MKTSIGILTDTLKGHGGEEKVLQQFSDNLSNYYQFEFIIPLYKGNYEWIRSLEKNKNTVLYNSKSSKIRKVTFALTKLIDNNFDIVICMTPKFIYLAKIVKKIFKKQYKIVSWQHFSIFSQYFDKNVNKIKKLYWSADYYFAISSGITEELKTLGIDPSKIYTIYNPVIPTTKSFSINEYGVTHFLCIARVQFNHQKNLQELFDACSYLKGKWILDIYGNDDTDGQIELKKCKNYLKKLGISEHVIWHGWVQNVWEEDIHPNCLVMTSNFEGFPMSLCEAASHGIPLISSNCPTGPADIINDKNGFLYQMHDIDELVCYMQSFINRDVSFKDEVVKGSISQFYVDNYVKNVKNAVDIILKNT